MRGINDFVAVSLILLKKFSLLYSKMMDIVVKVSFLHIYWINLQPTAVSIHGGSSSGFLWIIYNYIDSKYTINTIKTTSMLSYDDYLTYISP